AIHGLTLYLVRYTQETKFQTLVLPATLPVQKVLLENDMISKKMLIKTVRVKKKRAEKVGECGKTLV
ncbi:28819_t:CDS:2, partial [Gigaspora margarita]